MLRSGIAARPHMNGLSLYLKYLYKIDSSLFVLAAGCASIWVILAACVGTCNARFLQ